MKLFNKTSLKFFGGFAAIVAGSIAIAFIAVYFSPESREERMMERLQGQHANDTYGGDTPEETLELFIKALEDEDMELASKYYVVNKQKDGKNDLNIALEKHNLSRYISILSGDQKGTMYDDKERYEINFFDENGRQIHIEMFALNISTNKWKISEI